jgi:hypothetical protein
MMELDTATAWAELAELMVKMEATHSATLVFSLRVSSGGYRSFVAVDGRLSLPLLSGPGQPTSLQIYSVWPHPRHKTLSGLLTTLCGLLEKRLNEEVYQQRELPGV